MLEYYETKAWSRCKYNLNIKRSKIVLAKLCLKLTIAKHSVAVAVLGRCGLRLPPSFDFFSSLSIFRTTFPLIR